MRVTAAAAQATALPRIGMADSEDRRDTAEAPVRNCLHAPRRRPWHVRRQHLHRLRGHRVRWLVHGDLGGRRQPHLHTNGGRNPDEYLALSRTVRSVRTKPPAGGRMAAGLLLAT